MLSQAAGRTLIAKCWGPSSDSRMSASNPPHPPVIKFTLSMSTWPLGWTARHTQGEKTERRLVAIVSLLGEERRKHDHI